MKKERTGQKVKRNALEGVLWAGVLVLGLGLAGTFVFVITVLVSAPQATFVSEDVPPRRKPAASPPGPAPSVKKTPPAPSSKEPPEPGLVARYYRFKTSLSDLPRLDGRKEQLRKIEKTVDYESTDRGFAGTSFTENFAVRWKGLIRIPEDGAYTFFTVSDDGSWLYIDGKPVVRNPGLHSMEEQRGKVGLKKGDHEIRVDFFEGSGGAGCKLLWEAPGIRKAVVPEKALFHRSSD